MKWDEIMISPSDAIVRVDRVSKIFHIYNRPIDRLKQAIWPERRWFREFYALRDLSLHLQRGEALGIIGVNGSGKSTLLQIVAGTLAPTTGQVEVRGKIGALLELGAGFNPDFSGRENVFLSGAVMGFSRQQIRQYLPDIIDFAQIGSFIDQPVRIYSTGMFLRLAFSVCACLDPDVLLVDEALAVGDAGFVHKCLNRIRHLTARGVPIMLVTHDTDAVRSLCTRVIWIDQGTLRMEGDPKEVTSRYLQEIFSREKQESAAEVAPAAAPPTDTGWQRWGRGTIRVERVRLLDAAGRPLDVVAWGEPITVEVAARAREDWADPHSGFGIAIRNRNGLDVIATTTYDEGLRLGPWRAGQIRMVSFTLPAIMAPGTYAVCACVEGRAAPVIDYVDYCENVTIFKVLADKPIWGAVLPRVECRVAPEGEIG